MSSATALRPDIPPSIMKPRANEIGANVRHIVSHTFPFFRAASKQAAN